MNKKDLKNPLIQSGALLLLAFLLISIVAGSGSEGILGSIGALVSGLVSAVVFIVALCFAIIISIAVIIGIYIAAVSIYSVDKGRDLIDQLKNSFLSLYSKVSGHKKTKPEPLKSAAGKQSTEVSPPKASASVSGAHSDHQINALQEKIAGFGKHLNQLSQTAASYGAQIASLQQQVDGLVDTSADAAKVAFIEERQQSISAQLDGAAARIETNGSALKKLEQRFGEEQHKLKAELDALHEKTSVPEVISGILSYIDTAEERDIVTEKAQEAISRNMTYSQIDDFFKESLPPDVYQELAAHPRLTKDFLRSIKKKF